MNKQKDDNLFQIDSEAFLRELAHWKKTSVAVAARMTIKSLAGIFDLAGGTVNKLRNNGRISKKVVNDVARRMGCNPAELIANVDQSRFLCSTRKREEIQDFAPISDVMPLPVADMPQATFQDQSLVPPECLNDYFVRQDDLVHIKELMRLGGDPEKTRDVQFLTSLHGFPGIGKSELAVHLARDADVLTTFSNGVVWRECEPERTKQSENIRSRERLLVDLCRQLSGSDIGGLALIEQMQAELQKVLKDRSILLILDDVWDSRVLKLITDVMPRHCSILVTTPVPKAFDERIDERIRIYDVPELTPVNAVRLFRAVFRVAGFESPSSAVTKKILEQTGFLPATVIIAARTILLQRRRGLEDKDIVSEISCAVTKSQLPRVTLSSGGRSVSDVLTWALNSMSETTRTAMGQLPLLGTTPSTLKESDLTSIWGDETRAVIDELSDIGLLRFNSTKEVRQREFGINHFVYELASQVSQ